MKLSDEDREFPDEDKLIDSLKPALDLFSKTTFRTAEECIEHCRYFFDWLAVGAVSWCIERQGFMDYLIIFLLTKPEGSCPNVLRLMKSNSCHPILVYHNWPSDAPGFHSFMFVSFIFNFFNESFFF